MVRKMLTKYGTSYCSYFLHSSVRKSSACNAGDPGSIPGLEISPGEGNGNPLQYTCLENPMDREAWLVAVYDVARVRHDLATKPPPPLFTQFVNEITFHFVFIFFTLKKHVNVLS